MHASITMGPNKGERRGSVARRIFALHPDRRGVFEGYVLKYLHFPPRPWSPKEVDNQPFRRGGILARVIKCTGAYGGFQFAEPNRTFGITDLPTGRCKERRLRAEFRSRRETDRLPVNPGVITTKYFRTKLGERI